MWREDGLGVEAEVIISFLLPKNDSEQFYSNGSGHMDGGGSEQLNYAHSVHSGMHARSGF